MYTRGVKFTHFDKILINLALYPTMRASAIIERPPVLKGWHGLLNLTSPGKTCFLFSVLACLLHNDLHRIEVRKRTNYIPFVGMYDWSDLRFSIDPNKVGVFEQNNPTISINIYVHQGSEVYPLRRPTLLKPKQVHLLYVTNNGTAHCMDIIDLSRFLGRHDFHRYYWCNLCMRRFASEFVCNNHRKICSGTEYQRITVIPRSPTGEAQYRTFSDSKATEAKLGYVRRY